MTVPTPSRLLSTALLLGLVAAALTTVFQVLSGTVAAYSPAPFWDMWGLVESGRVLTGGLGWDYLWMTHNGHRTLFPKLYLILNEVLFSGRNASLIATIYLIQTLHVLVLFHLLRQLGPSPLSFRLGALAVIIVCLFSPTQLENFVTPIQYCWVGIFFSFSLTLLMLIKAREASHRSRPGRLWLWVALTAAMAATAHFSMANGNLIWPLLVLFALWLRLPKSAVVAITLFGALMIRLYFLGDVKGMPSTLNPLAQWPQMATYATAYLGSPLGNLGNPVYWFSWQAAVVLGILGLAGAAYFVLRLWTTRRRPNPAEGALTCILLFVLGSAALTALARHQMGMVTAITYHYRTGALIFWAALLLLAFSAALRREPPPPFLARGALAVFLLLFLTALLSQHGYVIERFASQREHRRLAEISLLVGTYEASALESLFPTPERIVAPAEYMRQADLGIFADQWDDLLEQPLRQHFEVVSAVHCLGFFDSASEEEMLDGGYRGLWVRGWAWIRSTGLAPEMVIIADDRERIVGLAYGGSHRREAVVDMLPHITTPFIGWQGYARFVTPWHPPLRAFAVLPGGRSAAPLAGLRDVPLPADFSAESPDT
jgi:hypothetical protein